VDPILDLIPTAEVWHLGFYRDENTYQPVEYYKKLPASDPVDVGLVLDPMLATGGSALAALNAIQEWGVPNIKLISVIAAPEGIEAVLKVVPNTQIYVCAIDECLNENKYIVPGLSAFLVNDGGKVLINDASPKGVDFFRHKKKRHQGAI